jgi:hypothetical protein
MIAPSQFPYLIHNDPQTRPATPAKRVARRRVSANAMADVAIRLASKNDIAAIRELEQLDSHALTDGARLVATLDGVPVAALAVADDSVVADPFEKTQPVVDLLRIRARQLRIAGAPLAA